MALNVTALFEYRPRSKDWSQQDLAEFYRIESMLVQGGLQIETARGLSDEGEPWFAFCRADNGEPVAHFALIQGQYVMASLAHTGTARGRNLRTLVQQLVSRHSLVQSVPAKSNVTIHPSALLIALIGAAFFALSDKSEAGEGPAGSHDPKAAHDNNKKIGFVSGLLHLNSQAPVVDEQSLGNYSREAVLVAVASALTLAGESDLAKVFLSQSDSDASSLILSETSVPPTNSVQAMVDDTAGIASHVPTTAAESTLKIVDTENDQHPVADVAGVRVADTIHSDTGLAFDVVTPAQIALVAPQKEDAPSLDIVQLPNGNLSVAIAPTFKAETSAGSITQGPGTIAQDMKSVLEVFAASSHLNFSQTSDQLPGAVTAALGQAVVFTEAGTIASFLQGRQQVLTVYSSDAETLNVKNGALHAPDTNVPVVDTTDKSAITLISNVNGHTAYSLSSPQIVDLLSAFLQQDHEIKVFVTHDSLVLVNSDALNQMNAGAESITLNFSDGSSLSMVGQAAAIHHIIEIV